MSSNTLGSDEEGLPRALQWLAQALEEPRQPMPRARSSTEESFGARLARLRRARGLTQIELAQRIGITRRMVAYYEVESDRPPAHVLDRLAAALQVSTDQLLGVSRSLALQAPTRARLWRRLRVIEELSPADQKAVLSVIEGLVARRRQQPA
jgi:transcriptional regulator with XRE-family HTH domain